MRRILHLHAIRVRRAGKACVVRLKYDDWQSEADKACFLGWAQEQMKAASDCDGEPMFPDFVLHKLNRMMIDG